MNFLKAASELARAGRNVLFVTERSPAEVLKQMVEEDMIGPHGLAITGSVFTETPPLSKVIFSDCDGQPFAEIRIAHPADKELVVAKWRPARFIHITEVSE